MVWVHATRIVTPVKDLETSWDLAILENPHNTRSMNRVVGKVIEPESGVAILVAASQPRPTFIQSSDLKLPREAF